MDIATHSWPVRLWQRTSLMQRLAFVALVPTLITAALLVILLTQRQLANLRQMAQSNADAIATQTASLCVQPLRNMQLRELLGIADSIGDLPHVTRVQIRTAAVQILADHRESADRYNPQETMAQTPTAKPNALQQPLQPSPELGAVVGTGKITRGEVVQKIWAYIKSNNLQNPANKREILADGKIKAVFGGKDKVSMFEMNKHLAKHLK